MYSANISNYKEILFVLDNLCTDTHIELLSKYGDEYKEYIFDSLLETNEKFVIRLKKDAEPVGLFGLIELDENSQGIFLLTTDNLHKGNVITFLKSAKRQIESWEKKYPLIMDLHYKENQTIKKWLKLLGFKASEKHQDDKFQIYYKGNIGLYKC